MAMNIPRPHVEPTWECTLPGPPGKNNGGAADIAASGLLAYAAGSSVSVVDIRSMQLVTVVPVPPSNSILSPPSSSSSSSSLSPFVTSVRWAPHSLLRQIDILSTTDVHSLSCHLVIAAGDRYGRLFLLDLRAHSPLLFFETDDSLKLGIQDICWVQSRVDTWILAAINGPHLFSLYCTSSGKCFFKFDARREFLACIRRDPFDSRHICVLGLTGLIYSVKVTGDTEDDVVMKELKIQTDSRELEKLERDCAGGSSNSPSTAIFPTFPVKCSFSIEWRHILFVSFPRELVVFDLQYETALFATTLPRGGKFLDILPDPSRGLLYCVHIDGKLSTWLRREGEQAYKVCATQELMPLVGSSIPSPTILAAVICQPDCPLQNVGNVYSDVPHGPFSDEHCNSHFDFFDEGISCSKTHLITISNDGKVWNWLLTGERADDSPKVQQPKTVNAIESSSKLNFIHGDVSFKVILVGQLHLLSSTVVALAVPSPSLTATLARGGNYPAVAVPLVALGTQSGTIEIIDVSANAIAACFAIHSGTVRGLRWLGNSRLVSFSYNQANEKTGGYINKVVVTCVRSGLNRTFRVFQKPEKAPIRALRASSSGRYLLILFRDAPVEVWAMTKNPIMLRSLALPFTVLEWTLPTIPRPAAPSRQSSISLRDRIIGSGGAPSSPRTPRSESSEDPMFLFT